ALQPSSESSPAIAHLTNKARYNVPSRSKSQPRGAVVAVMIRSSGAKRDAGGSGRLMPQASRYARAVGGQSDPVSHVRGRSEWLLRAPPARGHDVKPCLGSPRARTICLRVAGAHRASHPTYGGVPSEA